MRRRGGWLTLICFLLMAGEPARAETDFPRDPGLNDFAYCAAVFETRAELLRRWRGNPDAATREDVTGDMIRRLAASTRLQDGGVGSLRGSGVYVLQPYNLSALVREVRPSVQMHYEQVLGKTFPMTCMEDRLCLYCRDLLTRKEP